LIKWPCGTHSSRVAHWQAGYKLLFLLKKLETNGKAAPKTKSPSKDDQNK
jgi:hypothetical protein